MILVDNYKENEVFEILNADRNLGGQIILGKYKVNKYLDQEKVSHMIIEQKIQDDPVLYK